MLGSCLISCLPAFRPPFASAKTFSHCLSSTRRELSWPASAVVNVVVAVAMMAHVSVSVDREVSTVDLIGLVVVR